MVNIYFTIVIHHIRFTVFVIIIVYFTHTNSPVFFRHRALIGDCLAALASAFPVAFLEANLNSNNPLSITFNNRGGDYSLEARG